MGWNKNVEEFIKSNKFGVERLQWAVMNSVASLVYTEYIRNIRKKEYPREHTLIPSIKTVGSFLNMNGEIIKLLSDSLIKDLIEHNLVQMFDHNKVPDLKILDIDNIDITQTLLKGYILPNICRRIPETISIKFQIGNPEVKGIMDESPEIDIFKSGIHDFHYEYILEETALQLLAYIIHPHVTVVDNIDNTAVIDVFNNQVLIISHPSEICEIHLSHDILSNGDIMKSIGSVIGVEVKYPIREDDEYIGVISKNNKNYLYKYI